MQSNYSENTPSCATVLTHDSKIIDIQTARANQTRAKLKTLFSSSPNLQKLMVQNQGQKALDSVLDQKPAQEEPRIFSEEEVAEVDRLLAAALSDDDEPEQPTRASSDCDHVEYITDGATVRMIKAIAQPDQVERPVTSAKVYYLPGIFEQPQHVVPTIAPAFRIWPSLPQRPPYSQADDENLVMQYVADMEWLHKRGHRVEIDTSACDGRARHLLTAKEFDHDLARQMAADRRLSGDKFVALLYLPPALEAELRQLRSTRSKQKARDIQREKAAIEARFHRSVAASNRPEQARHVSTWITIWHCMRLVGDGPTAIGKMYESMTGDPMDKRQAQKLRDEIKKRLAGVMSKSS